jgi:phosphate transport system permease protein
MSAQQVVPDEDAQRVVTLERMVRKLHAVDRMAVGSLWVVTIVVTTIFVAIILRLLIQGVPYLMNPAFYGISADFSVGQQIFNTFYILILSEIILVPISLAAAIFLIEYSRQGPLVTFIHFAAETLAGVPSIVLGLFGYLIFATIFGLHLSRISGALTLLCLNFPIALRLFEDALTSVPREMREGSLSLGSTRWHMIRTVVLPSALPGIVTGIILTAGKIVGEAAALIFTMGSSNPANVFTLDPFISSDNLTINIYNVQSTGNGLTKAAADAVSSGSAALLIVILLVINLGARAIARVIERRVTAA